MKKLLLLLSLMMLGSCEIQATHFRGGHCGFGGFRGHCGFSFGYGFPVSYAIALPPPVYAVTTYQVAQAAPVVQQASPVTYQAPAPVVQAAPVVSYQVAPVSYTYSVPFSVAYAVSAPFYGGGFHGGGFGVCGFGHGFGRGHFFGSRCR